MTVRPAVRTPVRFGGPTTIRILGVDTGLANVGLCLVESTSVPDQPRCLHVEVFRTKKADKKARRHLRVAADDARRLDEIYDRIVDLIRLYEPHGIAVEAYMPNPNQRGVGAWKTAMAYALILAIGRAFNVAVFTNLPVDIKKPFGGRISASKEAIAKTLVDRVRGFREPFLKIGSTQKEHASDACAHGVLGIDEMISMRKMMGVR